MKARILLIDDNYDVGLSVRMVFEDEGIDTHTVSGTEEALKYLQTHPEPELILLDLNMPGLNGRDFIRLRRERGLAMSTPVLMFAATKDLEPIDDVVGWIRKPVDLEELLSTVAQYLPQLPSPYPVQN